MSMRRIILVIYLKYSFCFSLVSKMWFFHNCVMSTDGTSHEVEEKESLAFSWYYKAVITWYFLTHKMDLWVSIRSFVNVGSMFPKNKIYFRSQFLMYCFHIMCFKHFMNSQCITYETGKLGSTKFYKLDTWILIV